MSLLHATRRRSGTVGTPQSFAAIPYSATRSYPGHFPFSSIATARTGYLGAIALASKRQLGRVGRDRCLA
jgi:hypothetical protein